MRASVTHQAVDQLSVFERLQRGAVRAQLTAPDAIKPLYVILGHLEVNGAGFFNSVRVLLDAASAFRLCSGGR